MSKELAAESLVLHVRKILQEMDDLACRNLTHDGHGVSILDSEGYPIKGRFPSGGPFGAALAVSDDDGNVWIVGEACGNNVVKSGVASEHAESRAMSPDNYALLNRVLARRKAVGLDSTVWMLSSAQSCTTCHSKQEIMARDLMRRGLIGKGHFKTVYGATFDETFEIAQFYDIQYADALVFKAKYPKSLENFVRHRLETYENIPHKVREILHKADKPVAVVLRNGEIYAEGVEGREQGDFFATPEVSAIRNACLRSRLEGVSDSWNVDGTLYTTTMEMGPLLFSEAGWTKIQDVVSVVMPEHLRFKQVETKEVAELSNQQFLEIVAQGYSCAEAAVHVFQDPTFENKAQILWANVLKTNEEVLYNGAVVSLEVLKMRPLTVSRFTALTL